MMGLTAERELALRDANLLRFFEENQVAFKDLARAALRYARTYVVPPDLPLRRDDVASSLVIALNTNEALREYLAGKHLRQKLWYADFADLIVDRVWEELTNEQAQAG
jgi:hypothetical protein